MKDVKLEARTIGKRLANLVDSMDELVIRMIGQQQWLCIENQYRTAKHFYRISDGRIDNFYLLENADKINKAIKNKITHVTEESICDLLEEHLYLTAKSDLEKLLKKIQAYCPDSVIEENDSLKLVICSDAPLGYHAISNIIYNEKTFKFEFDNVHNLPKCILDDSNIFEDKENLTLNLDKPWHIADVINELAAEFPEYLEVNEYRGLSTINTAKRYNVINYNGLVGFADWHNGTLTNKNIFKMDNRCRISLNEERSEEFKQIVRDYFTDKKENLV